MKNLPSIKNAQILGKTVLLRADLDVPLSQQSTIVDDVRLKAWLPTLKYLLNGRAKVIIAGHLGRPEKKYQISDENKKFSLEPIARWLEKMSNVKCQMSNVKCQMSNVSKFPGWKFADNLFLLENLRFYKEEEDPSASSLQASSPQQSSGQAGQEFAKRLASLADIYVNDAFAVSHRNNASVSQVPKYLPHFAGFRLEKEVEVLEQVMDEPKRPLAVIVGGVKLETKLPLIQKMSKLADYVLVGGKLAEEKETLTRLQHEKQNKIGAELMFAELVENGEDITEASLNKFLEVVEISKTIIWNGPLGKVEQVGESRTSREIAKGIIESGAYSVVGGGDTIAFLDKEKLLDKFSFYSIGGGAMLAFLSGEKLPGIEALRS